MDHSYSESDLSLSPSQILERLQVLRQLQLLQQGKLKKQRLEYQEITENSSSLTEIVSHFSNTTSYNTFRSLLETSIDSSSDATPRNNTNNGSQKVKKNDLIDGISILNLSQESEIILNTSNSSPSSLSHPINRETKSPCTELSDSKLTNKKHISLDEMPILSPKKNFEALILEKLQGELNKKVNKSPKATMPKVQHKKQFLKRGEGTLRFGLQKKDFIIQNTKSLPWRKNSLSVKSAQSPVIKQIKNLSKKQNKVGSEVMIVEAKKNESINASNVKDKSEDSDKSKHQSEKRNKEITSEDSMKDSDNIAKINKTKNELPKGKHPLESVTGKTWATVLNKEQNDFLQKLKQSDYYKNFVSPTKSTISDASYDENLVKLQHERETAEQNMFELLESKVSHESFSLENTFFDRFLRRSHLDCSGESTPLVLQQCIAKNPNLVHIFPDLNSKNMNKHQNYEESSISECTNCCNETCSSVSSYCSCKTVEETTVGGEKNTEKHVQAKTKQIKHKKDSAVQKVTMPLRKEDSNAVTEDNVKDVNVINDDTMKANMVEMNAKLIATSELLKERLQELEDEIETFRQENVNLTKMREEMDAERQKFYEEKSLFEQKFNEDKILSEYYIAEEREKLTKQKQLYDKYVREMRGRLSKKDKEEVVNLKKEINDLKEDIRLKDAKYTSTIARLRNQIKIMEKEKKDFLSEIEKLKKENRRIQHRNDMTRRMTNIKYLEEINKKLSNMTAKETQSETNIDNNVKYKTLEIERQCRPKKVQSISSRPMIRAKSVPNLKVTSRYAKYFSQRDAISDMEKNRTVNVESTPMYNCLSDNDESDNEMMNSGEESINYKDSYSEDENNLEKLYMERFHSISPKSIRSNTSNSNSNADSICVQTQNSHLNTDNFFISKTNSNFDPINNNTLSPINHSSGSGFYSSKSPASILSNRCSDQRQSKNFYDNTNKNNESVSNASHGSSRPILSKSPNSILTNRSSSQNLVTVIHKNDSRDTLNLSPEPTLSTTSVTKTNLNPTEIKKPDGSRELRFPNGNVKFLSADGGYSKFVYYNGDVKENFYDEGRIKYFYAETKTYHTTHPDGSEVLEFPDGQIEKRYKDGSTEIRLPNGSVRYFDPKNKHVREEWRFPDGTAITISANGEQRINFSNGQVEVHTEDHKRREFPDGTVKLVYNDGTSETRYASGRVRMKDKHGNLIMDSSSR